MLYISDADLNSMCQMDCLCQWFGTFQKETDTEVVMSMLSVDTRYSSHHPQLVTLRADCSALLSLPQTSLSWPGLAEAAQGGVILLLQEHPPCSILTSPQLVWAKLIYRFVWVKLVSWLHSTTPSDVSSAGLTSQIFTWNLIAATFKFQVFDLFPQAYD